MATEIDTTGWDPAPGDPTTSYSSTEGISITLDSNDPPDVTFGYAYSPLYTVSSDFVVTGKFEPPTSSISGTKDIECVFYVLNENQSDTPPNDWRWIEFDWYGETNTLNCDGRYRPSGNFFLDPTPTVDISDSSWWRIRLQDEIIHWEVSADGTTFTDLGTVDFTGKSTDSMRVELDIYGNATGTSEDWVADPRTLTFKWTYLKVDDEVVFDNVASTPVVNPNVYIRSSRGWVSLNSP